MKAPFPYFGGKRRVASEVWAAIGDVDNYVEPFAGSMAVLLERPTDHAAKAETVNDADCYLSNFWRALKADPDALAEHCDWPVNECDLLARHLWLVEHGRKRIESMEADPDFYDAKVAGWWVWGINAWIGSGWCQGNGPWRAVDGKVVLTDGRGVNRTRPHLSNAGRGVNRNLPHLGSAGQGVNRNLHHLGDAGQGVNRNLPHLGSAGQGVNDASEQPFTHGGGCDPKRYMWDTSLCRDGEPPVYGYFRALAARLRRVRVCCGDWSRVVTHGALAYGDTVGVFLDPPYLGDVRMKDLYRVDNHDIANAAREWCIANGDNPRYRIVLAGYESEHAEKMPATWRVHAYSANAAYQTTAGGGDNAANRHNERLWFGPNCLNPEPLMFA